MPFSSLTFCYFHSFFFLCLTLLYVPLLKSFDVHLAVSTCLEYVENIFSHSLKKSLARETDTINSGTILQNFNFGMLKFNQTPILPNCTSTKWHFCTSHHSRIEVLSSFSASYCVSFSSECFLT